MAKIEKSSGNIFEDLGFTDSKERTLKTVLARRINSILKHRHLTQMEAAEILYLTQPKISNLKNGKLNGFSVEKLMSMLPLLGRDIEIKISSSTKPNAKVTVISGKGVEITLAA